MRNDRDEEFEPFDASSPTARVLDEQQLYGRRPHQDEPDPRPLPDQCAAEALADVFDALVSVLSDTRLVPTSKTSSGRRSTCPIAPRHRLRQLDRNEDEPKRS
jgi:hypothetical protein